MPDMGEMMLYLLFLLFPFHLLMSQWFNALLIILPFLVTTQETITYMPGCQLAVVRPVRHPLWMGHTQAYFYGGIKRYHC